LFSAVISEHFSKNRVIISVVAAKIWYLKKCAVFIGPPCIYLASGGFAHDSHRDLLLDPVGQWGTYFLQILATPLPPVYMYMLDVIVKLKVIAGTIGGTGFKYYGSQTFSSIPSLYPSLLPSPSKFQL